MTFLRAGVVVEALSGECEEHRADMRGMNPCGAGRAASVTGVDIVLLATRDIFSNKVPGKRDVYRTLYDQPLSR